MLESFQDRPLVLFLLVAGLAFWEGLVVAGLFTTSLLLVTVGTVLVAGDSMSLGWVVAAAFCGALTGDHSSYFLGCWLAEPLQRRLERRGQRRLARAQRLLDRWGWGAVIVGRLIPPIKSVVPFAAGLGGLRTRTFVLADSSACAIWAGGLALIVLGAEAVF